MTHTPGPWNTAGSVNDIWAGGVLGHGRALRIMGDIPTAERDDLRMDSRCVAVVFGCSGDWDSADEISGDGHFDRSDTLKANARLIAAAPALLEALEALSEAVKPTREGKRDGGTFGRLSLADDTARDAITLAKGETVKT